METPETSAPAVLPIVKYMIDFLRNDPSGAERFAFTGDAAGMLETGLDVLFGLPQDPAPTLGELVKFTCALELELLSPSAAALVRAVMYADPRVLAVFGRGRSDSAEEARARWCSEEVLRAPMYGEDAPQVTLKAGALADRVPHHIAKRERGARR
jgi:hypothetical protein